MRQQLKDPPARDREVCGHSEIVSDRGGKNARARDKERKSMQLDKRKER